MEKSGQYNTNIHSNDKTMTTPAEVTPSFTPPLPQSQHEADDDSSCNNSGSSPLARFAFPRTGKRGVPQQFPRRLYEMLDCETKQVEASAEYPKVISWSQSGRAFRIFDVAEFSTSILPKYFRTKKFSSFQRNLNLYGFTKIRRGPDSDMYAHPSFVRDRPEQLLDLRKINTGARCNKHAMMNLAVATSGPATKCLLVPLMPPQPPSTTSKPSIRFATPMRQQHGKQTDPSSPPRPTHHFEVRSVSPSTTITSNASSHVVVATTTTGGVPERSPVAVEQVVITTIPAWDSNNAATTYHVPVQQRCAQSSHQARSRTVSMAAPHHEEAPAPERTPSQEVQVRSGCHSESSIALPGPPQLRLSQTHAVNYRHVPRKEDRGKLDLLTLALEHATAMS